MLQSFFRYNYQPRGYISEGERTIDNQSEQAATLYMITNQSNSICHNYKDLDATKAE